MTIIPIDDTPADLARLADTLEEMMPLTAKMFRNLTWGEPPEFTISYGTHEVSFELTDDAWQDNIDALADAADEMRTIDSLRYQ